MHFGKVLHAVAEEMKRIRAAADPAAAIASPAAFERRPGSDAPAAPHSHASQLVDDYALLRASVVRLWRRKHPSPSADDLDDLVHFNEAMDRSLAELTATFSPSESQPQSLFLGVLNHELRTSVASILMSAQVLTHRSTPGTPEAKAAQRILRSCEQLRQSARRALRLHQGAPRRPARDRSRPRRHGRAVQAGARCLRARRSRAQGPPDVRRRPERRLGRHPASREAVGGLIANAARFASRGSWVTIAVDGRAADEVTVTVHGDGTPIDVETLQTIFDPVARVESENATYAGLGLGLFIVRKVVDAHGGHVSVEASAQDGTTFTMVLPRQA